MTSLITKGSLYDMLSIIIPGYLVYFLLNVIFLSKLSVFNKTLVNDDVFASVVIVFVISYIVGMVIHLFSKRVFGFLKFNECLARKAYSAIKNDKRRRLII